MRSILQERDCAENESILTTAPECVGGARPSSGAATYAWLVGSENRSAAQHSSIAAPEDGARSVVVQDAPIEPAAVRSLAN